MVGARRRSPRKGSELVSSPAKGTANQLDSGASSPKQGESQHSVSSFMYIDFHRLVRGGYTENDQVIDRAYLG